MRNGEPASSQRSGWLGSLPGGGLYLVIAAGFLVMAASGGLVVFFGGDPVSKWLGLAILVAAAAGAVTLVVSLISRHRHSRISGPGRSL
jgi:hypothetical protein